MEEESRNEAEPSDAHAEKIAREKKSLTLLLECRQYELSICKTGTRLYQSIQRDIALLEKRLSGLSSGTENPRKKHE